MSRLFPARVLGPERRKSDSREREGERETKGRGRHEREREREDQPREERKEEEEQDEKGEETNRLKQRENEETGEKDATVRRQPEKSADDTSSPQSESPPCRWDCLFPSSTNVHSLPNSLSAKQLNTHINTGDCSWRRSSKRSEEVKSDRAA